LIEKMLALQSQLKETRAGERKTSENKHKHKHGNEGRKMEKEKERKHSAQTEIVARNLTEKWVERHSRGPSEMGRQQEKKDNGEKGTSVGWQRG
jgi:hypothetical protein